jgi:multiple sugar transport system permease protein
MTSKKNLIPAALLSPAILVLFLMILLPTAWTFYLSFNRYSPGVTPEFIGFEHYIETLRSPEFANAVVNNLILLAVVIALQLVVAITFAFLLDRPYPLKKILVTIAIAPYAVSPISSVVVWRYMFNPNYGMINYLTTRIGLQPIMWMTTPVTAFAAIVITMVWKGYTFPFLIAYSSLLSIPEDLVEAARIDGASGFQVIRYVKMPMILPAVRIGLVFQVVFGLRTFDIPWVFTKGGPGTSTEILSMYLYKTAFRYQRFGQGSALGWIMLFITFVIAARLIWKVYKSGGVMN